MSANIEGKSCAVFAEGGVHMKSRLAEVLKLRYQPIAIYFTNDRPEGAISLPEGKWACVVGMVTAAMRGRTVALSRKTVTCWGGGVGMCFGNWYPNFPGGIEYFLSTGRGEGYRAGELYKQSPELAKTFVDALPMTDVEAEYVVLCPLDLVPAGTEPDVVVMYANCDQLSALVVLSNYDREGGENVVFPFSAGCQSICLLPYAERLKDKPRSVVGMADISARPLIDKDLLSFAVPYKRFVELEANVEECFFTAEAWQRVAPRLAD